MAESKIRDDNFYLVGGWMLNRLGLRGTALQIYAIIYGFSQDGEGCFTGSLQYLCDFTNASKNTVIKALKELVDRGLVTKSENRVNGVKLCTYKTEPVVQKLHRGGAETAPGGSSISSPGGGAETAPNNKSSDKEGADNKEYSSINQRIADSFNKICVSYRKVKVLTGTRVKDMNTSLKKFSEEDFRTLFEKAEESDFLKGKGPKGWKATFDWLIKTDNMVKVLEGNYENNNKGGGSRGDDQQDRGDNSSKWGNVGLNL